MTNVEQCSVKIQETTKTIGCILTVMSRLDFELLCRTNYIIDSQLSDKCQLVYNQGDDC